MPRIPRWRLGSGVFHVVNRAYNREWVFADDRDKAVFLELLASQAQRHRVTVYHWVVMSNHFHLAAEFLRAEDLSKYVSKVQSLYSLHFHKSHGGVGTLWQGRFRSVAVQKDRYLIELGRYIELNPVRAAVAASAWDYRWSSARAYALGEADPLVDVEAHPLWAGWGHTDMDRRKSHQEYLTEAADAAQTADLFRLAVDSVGDDRFRAALRLEHGRMAPRKPGRPRAKVSS